MLTYQQLQPGPMDTHPNIRCHDVEPPHDDFPHATASFKCLACDWYEVVVFHPTEDTPETVRNLAAEKHDRDGC